MEEYAELPRAEIDDRRGVARYSLVDGPVPGAGIAGDAEATTAFTNRQCKAVARSGQRMMARGTGDIEVAAQDLVEEELLAEGDFCGIGGVSVYEIGVRYGLGQRLAPASGGPGVSRGHEQEQEGKKPCGVCLHDDILVITTNSGSWSRKRSCDRTAITRQSDGIE